jgi:hypothetical protein
VHDSSSKALTAARFGRIDRGQIWAIDFGSAQPFLGILRPLSAGRSAEVRRKLADPGGEIVVTEPKAPGHRQCHESDPRAS